jgi:hypothetical protein
VTGYSSFDHLVASVCPNGSEERLFGMTIIEPQIVYVDDSGTEPNPNVRIVVAAFCVSTVKSWRKFDSAWRAVEQDAGFKQFHMTEFAGCRKDAWCRDCRNGKTDASKHPWREWSNSKRKEVLKELVRIVCKHTEQGFGIAATKDDIDKYVIKNQELKSMAPADAFGKKHFTFAASICGGELARWRAAQGVYPPIKFVFDLCSEEQKLEIAKAFVSEGQVKPRLTGNLENWFEVDTNGISFESRKETLPLLSADMLAWIAAKIRAVHLFPTTFIRKGWSKEMSLVAFPFIDSDKLHIGYNQESSMTEWLRRELEFWEKHNQDEEQRRIQTVQPNDEGANSSSTQRDQRGIGSGETRETKEAEA